MDIVPGVHLIEGVRGSNVYLLADDELALIDTGLPGNGQHILDFIRTQGRDPDELAQIIITHAHIDHMGSLKELQAVTGAKVVAHRGEAVGSSDDGYGLWLQSSGSYRGFLGMLARFTASKPIPIDLLAEDDDILPYLGGLRVIHTPGHTRGSICLLLEKGRVLFAGDTIINNVNRLSRPLPFGGDGRDSELSLLKLTHLDFDTCCFGHGPPLQEAQDKVKYLATNYPKSPLYWRIARNWSRLLGFLRNEE